MIRTLRFRFFLLVWPLVVVSLVVLGSLLGRWSVVQLSRVSEEMEQERLHERIALEVADSLATVDAGNVEGMRALLARMSARDSLVRGTVVATPSRGLLATALEGLRPEDVSIAPDEVLTVNWSRRTANSHVLIRYIGTGRRVDPVGVDDPRLVVVLPPARLGSDSVVVRRDPGALLTRRIALALVIGSVIAALVTLVLSRQLTGRVEHLAEAVQSVGRGDLAARVPVQGGDEIAELASSFNAMAAGLEASEAQRKRMVSDVAHELRTPLTNLIAMVESVRDGLRPADGPLMDALAEEAALLNRLVDDLRDLALSDAGDLVLEGVALDAAEVTRRAVESFAGQGKVRVMMEESGPLVIRADERRLGQVLRNLIQNAVTHSPEGGVVVVAPRPGADATGAGSSKVIISVRDQGPGIAPEQLPHIWERFWRADPSRARATGGMGLGLSVARRLTEAMGGTIAVESELGVGTTFTVSLPLG